VLTATANIGYGSFVLGWVWATTLITTRT
jgi:hypothetical protein